jgi:hypothetical protein
MAYALRRAIGALIVFLIMLTVIWLMYKAVFVSPFPPR